MLRFDFRPGSASAGGPALVFDSPVRTVVARTVDEVVPALTKVDAAVDEGRWAAGFVAYDAAAAFDPAFRVPGPSHQDPDGLPLVWFGLFSAPQELDAAAEPAPTGGVPPGLWTETTSYAAYAAAFALVQEAIRRGDTYQVNHTVRLTTPWDDGSDDLARYRSLLAAQGTAFGAFLDLGRHHVLSASPELFFTRAGDRVVTRPMKGTAPRGRSVAEDEERSAALRSSAKERAENVMIVDLLRNDLSKVAVRGTVAVPALCVAEHYPTVWQLTSTVTADVPRGTGLADLFTALFPCGSVTGAPKVSTMRLIADLEPSARGVYCGAIGVVAPGGDATFSVAIRTVVADTIARTAIYGVGSGVTVDSTVTGEHDEVVTKSAVLTTTPTPAFDLFETLRLEDGKWWQEEAHLGRISASAAFFGRADPVPGAEAALAEVAANHPSGRWRVRLTVDAGGVARTEVTDLPRNPDEALLLVLASDPVDETDVFLAHKTTWRAPYEPHWQRARSLGADDALLWNTRGAITEATRGNVVLQQGADWWTPPLAAGLLPGIERGLALAEGRLQERLLTVSALRGALARGGQLWFCNSVRGWRRARLLAY